MPDDGLDAEKLGVLRRWGAGLQADSRGEVAAAGRAITLLIDEIERLHVLVWDRRLFPEAPVPTEPTGSAPAADSEDEAASPRPAPLATLRRRMRRRRPQGSPHPDPQADSAPEADFPGARQQPGEQETEGAADGSGTA